MTSTVTGKLFCTQWVCSKLMLYYVFIITQRLWSIVASNESVTHDNLPTSFQCETSDCPTWFGCYNNTCKCNTEPELEHNVVIRCDGDRAAILACYCATTTDQNEFSSHDLIVGSCVFNCWRRPNHTIILDSQYFVLPQNSSTLNNDTCGWLKRTGPLCGKCLPNHSPPVYSYSLKCVECPHGHVYRNWLLFILLAFVPLTVFYIIILLLNINVASSSLHAFILFCQVVSSPPFATVIENSPNQISATIVTLQGFYVILWNLELGFLPLFCANYLPQYKSPIITITRLYHSHLSLTSSDCYIFAEQFVQPQL